MGPKRCLRGGTREVERANSGSRDCRNAAAREQPRQPGSLLVWSFVCFSSNVLCRICNRARAQATREVGVLLLSFAPVTAPTIDKPGSADRTAYHFLSFLTLRWLLAQLCDYWTWSLESRIPKGWLSAHSLVRKQTETRLPFYFLNHNLLRQPRTSTLQVAELAILFAFAVSHPREVQAMVHRSCRSARLQSFHRTSIHRSMQRPAGAVSIIAVGPLR